MLKQTGPNPEIILEKLKISPAEEGAETANCIVIIEGKIPRLDEIVSEAIHNQAHIDNSGNGAEEDQYTVNFPGYGQETLTEEKISQRLRELSGEKNE